MLPLSIPLCCLLLLASLPISDPMFEKYEERLGKPTCDVLLPPAYTARERDERALPNGLVECVYLSG